MGAYKQKVNEIQKPCDETMLNCYVMSSPK